MSESRYYKATREDGRDFYSGTIEAMSASKPVLTADAIERLADALHEARCGGAQWPGSGDGPPVPWPVTHREWDVATAKALDLLGVGFRAVSHPPVQPDRPDDRYDGADLIHTHEHRHTEDTKPHRHKHAAPPVCGWDTRRGDGPLGGSCQLPPMHDGPHDPHPPVQPDRPEPPEWIDLAADIRSVDGNHDLGAGALAAALTARGWTRLAAPPVQPDLSGLDALSRLRLTGEQLNDIDPWDEYDEFVRRERRGPMSKPTEEKG